MTKRSYFISALFLSSIVSLVVVSSCGPGGDDTPEPQADPDLHSGYGTDAIKHTHVYGTDSCPQPITTKLKIYCFEGNAFTECSADSVSIEGHSDGINIKFINGKKFVRLTTSEAPTEATLEFTCGIAKSFTQTYTLHLFKNGNPVGTETVKVVVTVEGN